MSTTFDQKEDVYNTIIGLNPTGILTYDGTYRMNGSNNIIQNSYTSAQDALKKSSENKIICSQVERFENYSSDKALSKPLNKFILLLLLIIFIIISFSFFFI